LVANEYSIAQVMAGGRRRYEKNAARLPHQSNRAQPGDRLETVKLGNGDIGNERRVFGRIET
jgi:hypothetical protein